MANKQYKLPWTAEEVQNRLEKIDNKLDLLKEDFVDTKTKGGLWGTESYTVLPALVDSNGGTEYNTSTFTGWGAYAGKPRNATYIRFPVKPREGSPISSIQINIRKLPLDKPISDENYYSPKPTTWEILVSDVIKFDTPLTYDGSNNWIIVEHKLSKPIENNESHLAIDIMCDAISTHKVCEIKSPSDLPFNTWAWYYLEGNRFYWLYSKSPISIDKQPSVQCISVEWGNVSGVTEYDEIGTKKGDKFHTLVNDVLDESGIQQSLDANNEVLNSMFEKEEVGIYSGKGSMDLTGNEPKTTTETLTSTFTGASWCIGKIPSDFEINGFALAVRARAWEETNEPLRKVYFYLYEADTLPIRKAGGPELQWDSLNAIPVRKVTIDVNVAVDETKVVNIFFDEPYYNVNNKYLYIGYNGDTYINKVYASPSSNMLTICGRNDGHNYSDATQSGDTVITFYSTSNNNTPNNAYGWVDINSIAYSIISRGFQYVPGDKLDGTIKDSVDKYIGNIEDQLVPEAEVRLAQQYDLVVGDKFQLFYLGVVKTFNIDNLGLNCVCVKGKAYPRYWEFEPTASDVGEYDLTIQCRRLDGSMISTGKTKIIVHPIPVFDAPTTKNILMFGDSLTSSGCWCSEGVRRLVGTNDEGASGPASLRIANLTINSIGNKTNTNNFYTIHHEGYGGWTWNSFLSPANTGSTVNGIIVTLAAPHGYEIDNVQKSIWVDNNGKNWELEDLPSDTTIKFNRGSGNNQEQSQTSLPTSMTCSSPSLNITVQSAEWESGNPFYNEETQKVDFKEYAAQFEVSDLNLAAALLTWNAGGAGFSGTFDYQSAINAHMNDARTLLRQLHSDFPNLKMICLGIQLPSITGGSAANYGANNGYADMWGTFFYAFDYDKALEALTLEEEFKDWCYYVDVKGQFDTIHNMPYTTAPVNTRSTTTEILGTNGVHPSIEGYYQIGDAFFRKLVAILDEE